MAGEQVGSYTITQGTLAATNPADYTTTYTGANLTITPAALNITANAATKVYGTNDPALTYTDSGLVNATVDGVSIADSLSGALTRNQYGTLAGEQVGSYALNQGTLAATNPADYTTAFIGANLSITKATLDVTANPETKVYGQADPALTYTDTGLIKGTVDGSPSTTAFQAPSPARRAKMSAAMPSFKARLRPAVTTISSTPATVLRSPGAAHDHRRQPE